MMMKLKLLWLAVSRGVFIYPRVLYVICKSYGKFDDVIERMIREKSLNSEAAVVLLYEMERDKLVPLMMSLFRLHKVRDHLLWLVRTKPFINHTIISDNELTIGCVILMRHAVNDNSKYTFDKFDNILLQISSLREKAVPPWLCNEIVRVTRGCVRK